MAQSPTGFRESQKMNIIDRQPVQQHNHPAEKYESPIGFFKAARETFARNQNNQITRYYRIGGFKIRLNFAGPALLPYLTEALEHLSILPHPEPELTVYLWDSVSTGAPKPDIPWTIEDHAAPGEIWSFNSKEYMIIAQPENKTIHMLDKETNLAYYWIQDAAHVPYHDQGAPLRMILNRWMMHRGRQLTHTAAAGLPQGGVLIAGRGGSGKSTAALACLNSELLYAGDDYCLLANDTEPYVFPLYSTGKLNAEDIERFPFLRPALSAVGQNAGEKALFFFHKYLPQKMSAGFPVRAILIPQITNQKESGLKRVSPARGLLALAPTTVYQLSLEEQLKANKMLGSFVRLVPNYILELGTDCTKIPQLILGLLRKC
jgi:hypothetical protein